MRQREWVRVGKEEIILEGNGDDGIAEEQINRMKVYIRLKTNTVERQIIKYLQKNSFPVQPELNPEQDKNMN